MAKLDYLAVQRLMSTDGSHLQGLVMHQAFAGGVLDDGATFSMSEVASVLLRGVTIFMGVASSQGPFVHVPTGRRFAPGQRLGLTVHTEADRVTGNSLLSLPL